MMSGSPGTGVLRTGACTHSRLVARKIAFGRGNCTGQDFFSFPQRVSRGLLVGCPAARATPKKLFRTDAGAAARGHGME